MEKPNKLKINPSALKSTLEATLENDVIETLAEALQPVAIPDDIKTRMKLNVMQKIKQETACESDGFVTQRHTEGEWVTAMPGAQYKILHNDGNGLDGLMSYLIKLEAGVEMKGHTHLFDEECLMLEGDLTLGDLTINKGDFHFAAAGLKHASVSTKNGCVAFIRGALPL